MKINTMRIGIVILIMVSAFSFLFSFLNRIKLEPGKNTAIWVQSQNGNDNAASVNIIRGFGSDHSGIKYTVEKFAEIGVIVLPDVNTVFPRLHDGTKLRDFKTAQFTDCLTIIDHNKICYMDGVITYWKVVSKADDNEVRLAIFGYDEAANMYTLIGSSPIRTAKKGLNEFAEEIPLTIKQNDILGLVVKNPIAQNRVLYNELNRVVTVSGFKPAFVASEAVVDSVDGSYSFSALLSAGKVTGGIADKIGAATVIDIPLTPVYGHSAWYKFTFVPESGVFYLKPAIASLLLNANEYIGLIQENSSPWAPQSFSWLLLASLALLFVCTSALISLDPNKTYQLGSAIASVLMIFCFSRYFASSFQGFQYVAIGAAFIIILLIPGVIISRYYPRYATEPASGRTVLAFVLSLIYWFIPAIGLFAVKTSYWPVIAAAIILVVLIFPNKQRVGQTREVVPDEPGPYWKAFQFVLWVAVALLAVHTLFSSRFHAERFDTFHHMSLAAKCFDLPIAGAVHANLYGLKMSTIAPYAYNIWGLLVGMVGKISGFDIGTIYCIGSSLLVLLTFITQWWLIGLFVKSKKMRITAFAVILTIYVTRSLATFAVIFQRTEFVFIMYGPSVLEFILYAVYIILGIRVIRSKRSGDLLVFCGLSLVSAFFHLEFILYNSLVLFLLIMLSLKENDTFRFTRRHALLSALIALLVVVGYCVKLHLALGSFIDPSSPHYKKFFGLRYEQYDLGKRFYYLFKDFSRFIHNYIWNIFAVWGGLLLVIFPGKDVSARMFRAAYCIIILMLLIIYNPISELVFTPFMTSWPLMRMENYLRALMLSFASIVISVSLFRCGGLLQKRVAYIKPFACAISAAVFLSIALTCKQWLPQILSTAYTVTYNQGNYFDITNVANLPELRFLNEYAKGKYVAVLVEYPYSYVIPSLSKAYAYFHQHYPHYDAAITRYNEREEIWKVCLSKPGQCKDQLPKGSLLFVRNEQCGEFIKSGYVELYRGRLFTVIKD